MTRVNEILDFNFPSVTFQQAAKNIFSSNLIQIQELRVAKLNQITQEFGEQPFKMSNNALIPQVFRKFKTISGIGRNLFDNFEIRELRTLTFSLSYSERGKSQIFNNPKELDFVFETLQASWRDSYLIGLIDCYLKNWDTQNTESREKLGKFIFEKLNQYEGSRTVLKSLKSNIRFFNSINGDVFLGYELVIKDKQIRESTKYLSIPESWFTYPYFSKVIVAYYEKRKSEVVQFIDDLYNALIEHNNNITNKRLVSKLIIQANTNEFASIQEKIKSIAFNLVGDPGITSNWASFESTTENEKADLRNARSILNEWITRQFINVFFEKCINDTRRKKFWLKYAKEISQFRVVGSSYIKSLLLNDNRIAEYVPPRFSNTNSRKDSNSALMFIMKNHLFIEFSDAGAFYAYKLSNPNAPSIEEQYFYSTSILKTPTMNSLIYRTGRYVNKIYDEGRLGHNDGELGWEAFAEYWIKNKMEINV